MATIMAHFSGETNRAQCLAHIVNLVAKIILRQFDMSKKKKKKEDLPNKTDTANDANKKQEDESDDSDDFDEQEERILDKEEKEMDEGDDEDDVEEDSVTLERDVEIMEAAMEDEIERVVRNVKPVRQVLYKVIVLLFSYFSFPFRLSSASLRVRRVLLFFFLACPPVFCCCPSPTTSRFVAPSPLLSSSSFFFGLSTLSTAFFLFCLFYPLFLSRL